jgi:hypothetical protein
MSANGGGLYNHYMAHVRRGEMTHTQWRTPDGHLYNDFKRAPKPAVNNQPSPSERPNTMFRIYERDYTEYDEDPFDTR